MMRVTSATDPLKLLLIEDNKGDAMLIEKVLKAAMIGAVEITREETLAGALKQLEKRDFDITLLDRSLPDVEGFSGLHNIQSFSPKMPVIFLTAYQDEKIALEAIQQGAQDYIFKDQLDIHTIKRAIQYATLRKQFEGVLIMRANFDMLTGLANRMLFESRLDMALAKSRRHGDNLAVLFIDLDRFKQVNDTLGHAAGDDLLRQVGKRIKSSLRQYDTAARFGGDEFAVLLEKLPDITHAQTVAQKMIHICRQDFQIAGQSIHIGMSIGIAGCRSQQHVSGEELMRQADIAMYNAKSIPGSCWRYYTPESEASSQKMAMQP